MEEVLCLTPDGVWGSVGAAFRPPPLPLDHLPPSLPLLCGPQHPRGPRKARLPSKEMPDTPTARMPYPVQNRWGRQDGRFLLPQLSPRPTVTMCSVQKGQPHEKDPGWLGSRDKGGPGASQPEAQAGGTRPWQNIPCSSVICPSPCADREVARLGTSLILGCFTDQVGPLLRPADLFSICRDSGGEGSHGGLPQRVVRTPPTTQTHTHNARSRGPNPA